MGVIRRNVMREDGNHFDRELIALERTNRDSLSD